MKITHYILVLLLLPLTMLTPQVMADQASETASRDAIQASGQLNDLQNQRNSLEDELDNAEDDSPQAQELQSRMEQLDQQIKVKRVEAEYKNLISSAHVQRESIEQALAACGNCANRDILAKRLVANAHYISYLDLKTAIEVCKVQTPPCEEVSLNALTEQAQSFLQDVTRIIGEINDLERQREVERGFDVSDIFNVNDDPDTETEPTSVRTVANTIADWLITLVSSLAVTALIIGGFLMIISGGDESRLETGKTIFTYSLIGLIITLMAYGIISFIQSIFY